MPTYYSNYTTDASTDYAYITMGTAQIRVEADPSPFDAVPIATDAVPDHQHVYYTYDAVNGLMIVEDDFEPEPTLKELVRDADWTI
jgi:hypothetical protein